MMHYFDEKETNYSNACLITHQFIKCSIWTYLIQPQI